MPALRNMFSSERSAVSADQLPTMSRRGLSGERFAVMLPPPQGCVCGAPPPMQVRLHLRSRTRPVFEGRWCCSTACLQSRIAGAVRREAWSNAGLAQHRHRVPLGLVLLNAGSITNDALRQALDIQRRTGERIGDVLVREFGLSERKLTEALAAQWGCSVWDVNSIDAAGMALLAPHVVLQAAGMVPLRMDRDNRLATAFAQTVDVRALLALQRIHGIGVDCGMISERHWAEAMRRVVACPSVPVEEITCRTPEDLERAVVRTIQLLQPVECRSARVRDWYWMRVWLEPAALAAGPEAQEDVLDFVYRVGTIS